MEAPEIRYATGAGGIDIALVRNHGAGYVTGIDVEDTVLAHEQDRIGPSDAVKVMTVHAAKGLEFPVVFVVALEEAIFPAARSLDNFEALEEERRLFYVAVTRAKERLYLSSSQYRKRYGDSLYSVRSRYIEEIEEDIPTTENMPY